MHREIICSRRRQRPPLWSSGQSSWLQIQRSRFDSRRYHIFREAVGLERGSISLVITTEELLERKNSGFGLESREHGRREASRWPRGTLYPQKLTLTSSTSGGRSFGTVAHGPVRQLNWHSGCTIRIFNANNSDKWHWPQTSTSFNPLRSSNAHSLGPIAMIVPVLKLFSLSPKALHVRIT
jgi:hypothetical protein